MNESENVLYPNILTEERLLFKYKDASTKLDETRKHEIAKKIKEFKKLYEKSNRLKKRWSNSEIAIMISSLVLTGGVAIAAGIFFPFIVALSVGASGSIIEIISYGTVHQLIAKKQKHYENKSIIIKSYIDKLQLLYEDIIKDNIITDDEYNLYLKLIKDYEKDINSQNEEMSKFVEEYKKSKINKDVK